MLIVSQIRSWWIAGLCVAVLGAIGCGEKYTGPWDLGSLYKVPQVEWVDSAGPIRGLYYAGEPYGGKATRVFAYYAKPLKVSGKAPAMVLVHGGGGKAFKEWTELWAKRGYAAIAMDLAGRDPDGNRLPDGGPDQTVKEKFNDVSRGLREAWPYHAVANVIRAHSLLRSFPEVDPDRIGITGISWGGYLTCIVAGLDDRFKAAVPVYACGFLYEDSMWIRILDRLSSSDRRLWIDNYDPSPDLPDCRMPILFVNGTNDKAFPLNIYQKSYRLIRSPRTLCVTVGMLHSHQHGWAPKEIGISIDSVLRKGEPLARFKKVLPKGQEVVTGFEAAVTVKEAALHYTTDSGLWQERKWHTAPAAVDGDRIYAKLPADKGIVYFLTVTDERGAVVSTEHEELLAENKEKRALK
ncbi:MAG: alpha/beta fold hydrolase [Planctomycetota bacterium]|nr:MAG: alpha/beta fold hydrolase [Planctomycetota bacterium]